MFKKLAKMLPKRSAGEDLQIDLYKQDLTEMLEGMQHPLVELGKVLDWQRLEEELKPKFRRRGRKALPVRLVLGVMYLQYIYSLSDREVVSRWKENPFYQYFCGQKYFKYDTPFESSSLARWRKVLGPDGAEKLLAATVDLGIKVGLIKKKDVDKIVVDTTVQTKAITYPTDSKLYNKLRSCLVSEAKKAGVKLRQTYVRVGARTLREQGSHAKRKHFKKAKKCTKKLHVILGRVKRDIERKVKRPSKKLSALLNKADKLLAQTKTSKNKIYSIHADEVECLSKGKPHKRYEFGNKVSIAVSAKSNWVLGSLSFHGSPYDGRTLKQALQQVTSITGQEPSLALCDMGYRGHNYSGECHVEVVNRYKPSTSITKALRKRRSAVEPIIGHLKAEHRLERNRLAGKNGDHFNAIMAAAGFNLHKMVQIVLVSIFLYLFLRLFLVFCH